MNKRLYMKFPLSIQNVNRNISALVNSSAELDDSVCNLIESNLKPRQHPGVMHHSPISLPKEIKNSIDKLLSGEVPKKQLLKEAIPLRKYLMSRKPPSEKIDYLAKQAEVKKEVLTSMGIDLGKLTQEEKENYDKIIQVKVDNLLKKRIYHWNRIDFTRYMSILYVATRSCAEYSVLFTIFKEIEKRGNFIPRTVFDFGCGMGSVIWASNAIWGNSVCEYYCVDSSSQMIAINENIIKGSQKDLSKIIYYRQFLPSSNDITSDIVVSAYSLMELPSKADRLETLTNLWKRTKKYLVLVEMGSTAGFKLLNEARDHIIEAKKNDCSRGASHIFAPCPHHMPCPRAEKRCFFEVSYLCFPQKPEVLSKEFYSYIVFEKGEQSDEDKQWPRIVQPVLCRSKHVICRLCCKSGDLKEVIVTPSKHGKISYRCAKASRWGDLFPFNLKPHQKVKEAEDLKSTLKPKNTEE